MPKSSADKKIKGSVSYRVFIKSGERYFKLGTIVVKTYSGDIYFVPSTKRQQIDGAMKNKEIDHLSWHASGIAHLKYKGDGYQRVRGDLQRQKISDIGFQELLLDKILSYKQLPAYQGQLVDLDVVLNACEYDGPVCFCLSVLSSFLIIAQYRGKSVPVKLVTPVEEDWGLGSVTRFLGHLSGNGDKMLQFSLKKTEISNQPTNRAFYVPNEMNISKADYRIDGE